MNAEQFISIADSLRSRALDAGADINASNFLVHATLMRALREQPFERLAADKLAREAAETQLKPM